MPLKRLHKHPFLLLEALIAFALVALCVIPLIYPHVGMLKAERRFVRTVELDHVVNLLYADILEKLYLNKIGINDLFQVSYEVDETALRNSGYTKPFPFFGSYKFTDKKHKPKQAGPYGLYLVQLNFTFLPKEFSNANPKIKEENTLEYEYEIFLVRDQRPPGSSTGQSTQGGQPPTPQPGGGKGAAKGGGSAGERP